MARDDYHVIAYTILAYLYKCLKSGIIPDFEVIAYNAKGIDLSYSYWEYIIRHLYEDGYVEGVALISSIGSRTKGVKLLPDFMITPKGIEYLEENSNMSKAKSFLKEIKATIPGL